MVRCLLRLHTGPCAGAGGEGNDGPAGQNTGQGDCERRTRPDTRPHGAVVGASRPDGAPTHGRVRCRAASLAALHRRGRRRTCLISNSHEAFVDVLREACAHRSRRYGKIEPGEHPRRVELARTDCAVHRSRRARCRGGPAADHGLRGLRPDRAEPARGQSGAAADAAAVPAGRASADRAGRRRDRTDRRPARHRRARAQHRGHRRRVGGTIRGQLERFVDFDGPTGAHRREQPVVDIGARPRSTSCATSASTSRST